MVGRSDLINQMVDPGRIRIGRGSRVSTLKRQIEAGQYRVDPERIAEVLLQRASFHRSVRAGLLNERRRVEA
jgi:anti-sigma28 factor (negative regulator of flagellin synthesis)